MDSFLPAVTALGEQIHQQWHAAGNEPVSLAGVAVAALEGFDARIEFDPHAVGRFLAEAGVEQEASVKFSDLPVALYRGPGFYIELLVWSRATTSVHAHGFSGAFRVVQGSSLHTRYRFEIEKEVDEYCQVGRVAVLDSEVLSVGTVRPIVPGPDGSIHGLYHLDNPSMTLVVRTYGLPEFSPQFSYFAPGLALYPFHFENDATTTMIQRLLAVTRRTQRDALPDLWTGRVATLEFSQGAWLYLQHLEEVDELGREMILDAFRRQHGALADALAAAGTEALRVQRLSRTRAVVRDPDLRFFIALLMNLRDRASVLSAIATRYPGEDPAVRGGELMAALSRGRADTEALVTRALAAADVSALEVGRRLGAVVPDADAAYFARVLRGQTNGPEIAPLQAIDELGALFR